MRRFFFSFVLLIFFAYVHGQSSPCPELFNYVKWNEPGKWHGEIRYVSEDDLIDGVFIVLVFDKPSISVGATFGQNVIKRSPTEYLLRNLGYVLKANVPLMIKFFIDYDPRLGPPHLTHIRVNGRQVCPNSNSNTVGYITSKPDYGENYNHEQVELELDSHDRPLPQQRPPYTPNFPKPIGNNFGETYTLQPLQTQPQNVQPIFSQNDQLLSVLKELLVTIGNRNKEQEPENHQKPEEVKCGLVTAKPIGLIANGGQTVSGEWPWHAALIKFEGAVFTYLCGGTLIGLKTILTAAHCVTDAKTNQVFDPSLVSTFLGNKNLRHVNDHYQQRDLSDIIVHPDFEREHLKNDIAILKLVSNVKITDYVRPVCLWSEPTDLELIVNRKGTVVGWGTDEKNKISNVLQKVQIPVVAPTDCLVANANFLLKVVWEKNYCAGYSNATQVCNGDSGGGMFFPLPGTSGADSVWQIRGIVSLGFGKKYSNSVCESKEYTVFTDVAQYLYWINRNLS